MKNRPGFPRRLVTTPLSGTMLDLLGGGAQCEGVSLTSDEMASVRRLYGIEPESNPMMQAGADRNALRHAQSDGLRMLAWFAKHVEPGEDPLRVLVRIVADAGYDVAPEDWEWADSPNCEGKG